MQTSARTFCPGTPPSRSAAARWEQAGGTTVRFTLVLSQGEVWRPLSSLRRKKSRLKYFTALWFILFIFFFFFPDDFNKLCPHGTGLLPLMVSSLENHRAFIGMLAVVDLLLTFVFVRSELSLWPQMQMSVKCLGPKYARTDSVQTSSPRTPATATVASTTTTSGWSVWVSGVNTTTWHRRPQLKRLHGTQQPFHLCHH